MTSYIGIDLGLDGALALIDDDGLSIWDCPTAKAKRGRVVIVPAMAKLVAAIRETHSDLHAAVERPFTMPKGSVVAGLKIGFGAGAWEGILAAHGIPTIIVASTQWKREIGIPKGSPKDISRARASSIFPVNSDQFKRVKDDGRAEAALIAEWRRRLG